MASRLVLRPLGLQDEEVVRAGHEVMATEGFTFVLGYDPALPWAEQVTFFERCRRGEGLPERWVPSTFLIAEVDGAVVGRVSIRHELNEFLAREGGHVGYGVLPGHRRRGYATEMLRQSVELARRLGIERVLVTCDDDNVGSATVIERCGGVLESRLVTGDGVLLRRYWIG